MVSASMIVFQNHYGAVTDLFSIPSYDSNVIWLYLPNSTAHRAIQMFVKVR